MDGEISQEELENEIEKLNGDPAIHGILVQLPLPKQKRLDDPRGLRIIRSIELVIHVESVAGVRDDRHRESPGVKIIHDGHHRFSRQILFIVR